MLFKREILDAIEAGEVTLAFRRWKKPTVRAGGTLRTSIGVIAIDAVERVAPERITEGEARKAGCASRAELLRSLEAGEGTRYRIALRLMGEDPRVALRASRVTGAQEREAVEARLQRLDRASSSGPWTQRYLELIRDCPGVRAPDLALSQRLDTATFKRRVRRLKELGLTESLSVGYRLSPRGASYLASRPMHDE